MKRYNFLITASLLISNLIFPESQFKSKDPNSNQHTNIPLIQTQFEEKYSIPLYESYGLSETLFVSSNSYEFQKNNSVGKLLQNVELTFSQNNEIIIKVPWMFKNYLNIDSKDFFKNKGDSWIQKK